MGLFAQKSAGVDQSLAERLARTGSAPPMPPRESERGPAQTAAPALVTRFGSRVDVRNRGAVRIRRLAGGEGIGHAVENEGAAALAPAVVRLWHGERCDELTIAEARALAGQLMEAAALADGQNRR